MKLLSVVISLGLFFSNQVSADWKLDEKNSRLSFVSTKNGAIVEVHEFKELAGHVTRNGEATLVVKINSIETLIPIRNERMQQLLFSSQDFPEATIKVQLDADILNQLRASTGTKIEVFGDVTISGQSQRLSAAVLVSGLRDGGVVVSSQKPVLVAANQFGLMTGIEALREIAGLSSITPVVPVMFTLQYAPSRTRNSDATQNAVRNKSGVL